MDTVTGYVDHIIFQNKENGYAVVSLTAKGEEVVCVGNFRAVEAGETLELQGSFVEHPIYGSQLKVESARVVVPDNEESICRYLGSGAIKGIGESLAAKIVKKFGEDTFRIMEQEPERLAEIKGISERKAREISAQVEEKRDMRQAMIFLQKYGISTTLSAKIYQHYGQSVYRVIEENPYQIADHVPGVGFKTADEIAIKVGMHADSDFRVRSGIFYTLLQSVNDGHIFLKQEVLLRRASELLGVELTDIERYLMDLAIEKKIVIRKETDGVRIYPSRYYYMEMNVARMLHDLDVDYQAKESQIQDRLHAIEERGRLCLDEMQRTAVVEAMRRGVMVLTGGPGTGKTTTINAMLHFFDSEGMDFLLAAPTGRAAKRMTEATGYEAQTIHRLLECKPPEGYQKNGENPLKGDVLIVDECSMIDIVLMNALLKAVPDSMRLVLVGDTDQLPSVGAGNVLRDVIESGAFPVVRLTRIFRQALESRIIMNAHRINAGQLPDISNGRDTDFFFLSREEPEQAVAEIVDLVKRKLPARYGVSSSVIQVLTPMQRGAAGATSLNLALQEALNPAGEGLRRSGFVYRQGDRVMQVKNNYDKEVFNGDIGRIETVNPGERTLKVDFEGRLVEYDQTELDELVHAYAATIHKAQGSEYQIVVMPILMSHYVMLQRNLVYTGITRAKKILVMVGTKKALAYAVQNVTVTGRNSMLKERLAGRGCLN